MFCMFPIPKVSEKKGQPVRVLFGKKLLVTELVLQHRRILKSADCLNDLGTMVWLTLRFFMNKVKSQYPCWNLTSSYFCLDFKVIKCCRGWVILHRNLLLRWSGDLFFFQDFAIGIPFVCLIIFKKNKGFVEMTKFYKQNLKRPKQRRKFHKQDMKSKTI